jgi:hypothetical protein
MDAAEKLSGARNLRYCYGRATSPLGRLPQPKEGFGEAVSPFLDTQSGICRFRNPRQIHKILSKLELSENYSLPPGVAWMDVVLHLLLD